MLSHNLRRAARLAADAAGPDFPRSRLGLTGDACLRHHDEMRSESKTVIGCVRDGVGELAWRGPFTLGVWDELLGVAEAIVRDPFVEVLRICGDFEQRGADDDEDRRRLWDAGRALLRRWSALPVPTVAVVSAAACGTGWEFLQAFDVRLAVAGPDGWFTPPAVPAWVPVRSPVALTAREAVRAGVLDDAYCERVAGIETRLHLDRLLRRPRKRKPRFDLAGAWALRPAFLAAAGPVNELPPTMLPRPTTVAVLDGGPLGAAIAVETILRGGTATVGDAAEAAAADRLLGEAVRRGRVTPLEAEQARKRLYVGPEAPRFAEARWLVTTRPQAVEFLRKRLHPWAVVTDLRRPDTDERAWCGALRLTIPPSATRTCYTADGVATKIAS